MDWYELLPKILNMSLTASVIIVTVIILRLLLKRAQDIFLYVMDSCIVSSALPYHYKYSLIGIGFI